jgi:hypothetical protein
VVQAADGATTLQTADQVAEMKAYLHASGQDHLRRSRRALHTQVRNNLDFRDAAGRLRGYGAFTGEPGVSAYWRVGMIDVQEGDVLALFTDGVAPYVDMPEFTAIVRMFVGDRNHSTCAMQLSRLFDRWSGREGAEFRDDKALIVVAL